MPRTNRKTPKTNTKKKQKLIESRQSQQKIIKLQKSQIESRELINPIKSQKSQQKIINLQKSE